MREAILGAIVAALIAAGGVYVRAQGGQAAGPSVPGTSARDAIDAAAAALGGAQRLQALRNLTLIGYAQYAYQNGGGNISPLPGAPQKFIAGNDYRRIYDLQNKRMLHQERRNDLFPFANYGGHSFALARQGLDGTAGVQRQCPGGGQRRRRRARSAHVVLHQPCECGARGADRRGIGRQSPAAGRPHAGRPHAARRRQDDAGHSPAVQPAAVGAVDCAAAEPG